MRKIISKLTLIMALTLMCINMYGQEPVVLKYNFKEGKAYKTTTKVNTNIVQSMMGQEMKIGVNIDLQSDMKVTKIEANGNATMLITAKGNLVMDMPPAAGGQKSEVITSEDITAIFTPEGVAVNQALVDKDGKPVSTVKDYIKLTQLPKNAIKAGDTWQEQRVDTVASAGSPMSVITASDLKYTVAGKEVKDGKELFKITFEGTMEISGKGSQMGMEMAMEGTGATNGFFYFNPAISMVVSTESTIEMNTNINVSGPQNMTIPMTQSIKVVSNTEEI